jgi:hypothetical protein
VQLAALHDDAGIQRHRFGDALDRQRQNFFVGGDVRDIGGLDVDFLAAAGDLDGLQVGADAFFSRNSTFVGLPASTLTSVSVCGS